MRNEYYVEVVASDGVRHHVGPFEHRSYADAWIRQHWRAAVAPTAERDTAPTAIREVPDEERLL